MFIYHFLDLRLTMLNLDCVFLKTLSQKEGDNPLTTVLIDIDKEQFVLNLWSPWNELGDYLPPFTPLKIFNVDKKTDDDIVHVNIPTGIPLIYELDDSMNPLQRYYLGDSEKIKKATAAVRDQGKT